jgi:hypothetical protein
MELNSGRINNILGIFNIGGKIAPLDQASPEQPYHLTPLILKEVGRSIKIGRGW